MQHRIEEYFPKADILRDYEKELWDFLSKLHMNILLHIYLDNLFHIFLLDEIDDLPTIGRYLKWLAGHEDFLVIKDLPIREARHYTRENLVEVLIHRWVLVAELFGLVEQVLAQQVLLDLDLIAIHVFILTWVIIVAHLVLLLHLFNNTIAIPLPFLAFEMSAGATRMAHTRRRPLSAVIVGVTPSASARLEHFSRPHALRPLWCRTWDYFFSWWATRFAHCTLIGSGRDVCWAKF